MPERIQQRRTKGWRMPPNTVSVARPHRWGNPFPVAEFGLNTSLRLFANTVRGTWNPGALDPNHPDEVWDSAYEKHTEWLKRLGGHPLELIRVELGGRNLACFCHLDQPCHADIELVLANPITATPEKN